MLKHLSRMSLNIYCAFGILICVHLSEQVGLHHTAGDFCYADNVCDYTSDKWSGLCKDGHRQSPIDIPSEAMSYSENQTLAIEVNDFYKKVHDSFFIRNNGHTVQIQLEFNQTSDAFVTGIQFEDPNKRYIFAQMHFHWGDNDTIGSEHRINGKGSAMEIHFVHYSSEYSTISEASKSNDSSALAVIGVLVESSNKEPNNPYINSIIAHLPRKYMPEPVEIKEQMNLSSFLPSKSEDREKVFRYGGSLTTPPCSEFVSWAVFVKPIFFHPDDIEAFRSVEDNEGFLLNKNCRPIQSRGDLVHDLHDLKCSSKIHEH